MFTSPFANPDPKKPAYEEVALDDGKSLSNQSHLVDHHQSKHARRHPIVKATIVWTWELLACLGAAASLVAISAFLSHYSRRPKPDWNHNITLNSIVSVFALVLKACVLMPISECISAHKWMWYSSVYRPAFDLDVFDRASRGVSGSVRMLYRLQFKSLGVIGALLTICALGIDPIVQLSLQYATHPYLNGTAPASVPVSRNYSESDAGGTSLVDEAFLGAFQTSIISPNASSPALNADCPTGQCNFTTPYETMGFCSTCENISYLISAAFNNASLTLAYMTDGLHGTVSNYSSLWVNASLPGGPFAYQGIGPGGHITAMNISSFVPQISYSDVLKGAAFGVPLSNTSDTPNQMMSGTSTALIPFFAIGPTLSTCTSDWMDGGPRNPDTDCLVLSKMQLPNNLDATGTTGIVEAPLNLTTSNGTSFYQSTNAFPPLILWPNITATLCTLSLCQKSLNATVTSGSLNEVTLQENNIIQLNRSNSMSSIERDYVAVGCSTGGQKHDTGDYLDPTLFDPVNASVDYDTVSGTSKNKALLDNCTYKLSNRLFESSFNSLAGVSTGVSTFTGDPNSVVSANKDARNLTVINPWGYDTYVDWQNQPYLASLYNEGYWSRVSMDHAFEQIAETLTNHLRLNDFSSSSASGEAYTVGTVVFVDLWWLVLPTFLVACVTGYLVVTIRATALESSGMDAWKSSQVALLYHGYEDREGMGAPVSKHAMKPHAEATAVKLGREEVGWRLVRRPGASTP